MKTMNNQLEINLNIADINNLRLRVNGTEYMLTPIHQQQTDTHSTNTPLLADYVHRLVKELVGQGRRRTAETYRCALNRFAAFLPHGDIPISDIDKQLIVNYERHLKADGLTSNTTSFYMRVLHTIYNRAVNDQYTADQQPFTQVYTGIAKTRKRAITLADIQHIRQLSNLPRHEELARDLFLFSLYTRGMAYIDMAYLKPANITGGILTYRRHKTGQTLSMRWEQQMQEIVDLHPSPNADYLLPIIKRSNGRERSQYRESQRMINYQLKSIGQKISLSLPLTMYVARHSWASIAHSMNIPLSIISAGMGHTSEHTTQIYLKTLDSTQLDTTNASIIQAINSL